MTLIMSATILYASMMLISTLNWQLTTIETDVTAIQPRQLHFVSVSVSCKARILLILTASRVQPNFNYL